MKDLGNLKYFLRIDEELSAGTISIRQSKFAKDILEKFGMENSNPDKPPQEPGLKLTTSMYIDGCKLAEIISNVHIEIPSAS